VLGKSRVNANTLLLLPDVVSCRVDVGAFAAEGAPRETEIDCFGGECHISQELREN
jgi:hypothetical protein